MPKDLRAVTKPIPFSKTTVISCDMHDANDKSQRQDRQYDFPYHYLPHFDSKSSAGLNTRTVGWGLEYLCYTKHILQIVCSLSPGSVLDVGCGDGRFLGMLKLHVPRLVGADLSEKAIRFAKAFHPDIEFHAVDASEMDDTFDLVLTIETLEHVPDDQIDRFITALSDRARRGGQVIISVPTKVSRVLGKHYRHYDIDLLKRQLVSANVPLDVVSTDYVYKQHGSLFFEMILKTLHNKWWMLDIFCLRGPIWYYIWHKLRFASPATGRHLIALLKKSA